MVATLFIVEIIKDMIDPVYDTPPRPTHWHTPPSNACCNDCTNNNQFIRLGWNAYKMSSTSSTTNAHLGVCLVQNAARIPSPKTFRLEWHQEPTMPALVSVYFKISMSSKRTLLHLLLLDLCPFKILEISAVHCKISWWAPRTHHGRVAE